MGRFTDTKYAKTIDSLVNATKEKINNPFYVFSDKKPTRVTYYAQNIEKSTLDQASGLYMEDVGVNSPFKFNKITDFILYGIDRISTEYEVGDYGVEASNISGNAIVLPNTITPRPGDFFTIEYTKENLLFKVNSVSADTLDTGANIFSLEYALEFTNAIADIESQVYKKFYFLVNNVGTDFKTIIQDCDYNLIEELNTLISNLITYFENIFFDNRLQTFVYNHDGWHMYDPFLIEFLIRNKVMLFNDTYIHVSHAASTNKTFGMDYIKTFFYSLENPKNTIKNVSVSATADMILDPNSLFSTRLEKYYQIRYFDNTPYKTRLQVFDPDVISHIKSNTMYEKGNTKEVYNLWIAYFNGSIDSLKGNMVDLISNIDYFDNLNCFYGLAISIFILEQYVIQLLAAQA